MKFPPWLVGLLLALVLAGLWWVAAGGSSEEEPEQAARPTPTAPSTAPADSSPSPTDPDGEGTESTESTDDDQGSDEGSDDHGSDDQGSDDQGSDDQGSDDQGSDDQGSDEGTDDQGADDQYWAEPTGVDTRPRDGIEACADDILPATMVPVIEDIWANGPYDYPDRDGTRFGNYEGLLPDEELGYYREFTVRTPGLDHRGARRIVTGGWGEGVPEVWYYTEDHYESFCEFAP